MANKSAASALASLRWAKTTAEERTEIARKLNVAKAKKAEAAGTLRAQTPKRRSRKPSKPKPKA